IHVAAIRKLRPLRSDVADTKSDVASQFALEREAVLLRIAVQQMWRNSGESDRTGSAGGRERIGKRELWRAIYDVVGDYRSRGVRSRRELAGYIAGLSQIVDAPPTADDRLPRRVKPVGKSEARREVVLVRLAQRAAEPHRVGGLDWQCRREVRAEELRGLLIRHHDLAGGEIERIQIVVERVRRAVILPAETVHHCESRVDLEIVLREE